MIGIYLFFAFLFDIKQKEHFSLLMDNDLSAKSPYLCTRKLSISDYE